MSKKLMIVDDSRVVYASMSKMLENSGWEIAQFCRSGEEALKTYPDIQPDVVTMDIVMPGMATRSTFTMTSTFRPMWTT